VGGTNVARWVVGPEDLAGLRGDVLREAGAREGDELVVLVVDPGFGTDAEEITTGALRAADWEPS
jgi:hypothetical protein